MQDFIHLAWMKPSYLGLTMHYISRFIAEMLLGIGRMWGIEFAKSESKELIEDYASQL